jgi:thiol-disulfide isomerase/thioredoxin
MAVRMSRKVWVIVAIVVVAVGATVGITLSDTPAGPANPPDSALSVITWNETTLSTFEGTPIVLNFWSIGCSWCRYQLPFLEAVAQQSEGELGVIAVNTQDSASRIRTFFGDYVPAMTIAVDENRQAFRDYSLAHNNTGAYIPFTLLVDSEGVVQYAKTGAFASEAQLWDTLNDVLGVTAPETS